jgi:glycine/serine hydroxymethyltransferase
MGMKEADMYKVADCIDSVCRNISRIDEESPRIRSEIAEFCSQFAIPGITAMPH